MTDYDQIASTYNRRYEAGSPPGIERALDEFVGKFDAPRVLEAGCGTGHWLTHLKPHTAVCAGIDPSAGMLRQAAQRGANLLLARAPAEALPFAAQTFDVVFCVNAVHHFQSVEQFLTSAFRCLRPGGRLTLIGHHTPIHREDWYVYDYFAGTYETDEARFPTAEQLTTGLAQAGFVDLRTSMVEHISHRYRGREVFSDPFLEKNSCSQLAMLSQAAYAAGLEKMRAHLDEAEARGVTLEFHSDIKVRSISAFKPARPKQP
jgi:ubiquinone/menaquinone biosynthesis C-methylase UbiE